MQAQEFGHVTGGIRTLLRLEGLVIFLAATVAFFTDGGTWWLYLVLFLVPDLAFLAYPAGERIGAMVYNALHTLTLPVLLLLGGWLAGQPLLLHIALIWLAHIGIDRAVGYGLKYPSGFGHTHLGPMGKAKRAPMAS